MSLATVSDKPILILLLSMFWWGPIINLELFSSERAELDESPVDEMFAERMGL